MTPFTVDILIPVWNRPVETRNCLVTLMDCTPTARFILIDNGSDRETERLLEEFAEILGERALFLKTSANQGFVKAVNRGLAQVAAPYAVIMRNTTLVARGWLEPMVALADSRADAGVIVPRLEHEGKADRRSRATTPSGLVTEISHGSFAAAMVRRDLVERQGGFDEELDGGLWCLKDYSRRAFGNGFLTFAVEGPAVTCTEDVPLGSVVRRNEVVRRSAETCQARWGREDAFCVYFPREAEPEAVHGKLDVILQGARMGQGFTLVFHPALYRSLVESGYGSLHREISLVQLPRFFATGEIRRVIGKLVAARGDTIIVAGVDGLSIPGVEGAKTFGWLEDAIRRRHGSLYRPACDVKIG